MSISYGRSSFLTSMKNYLKRKALYDNVWKKLNARTGWLSHLRENG
ncbi:hypothetical protein DB29_03068 [Shouchella clausii]|nr:hypothetical protein DB29_03068 [Shouchella clausii]